MSRRNPTQNDVAKAAGVSQSLVSLVLGESSAPVAKETRQRILDAAHRLGFISKTKRRKSSERKLLAYIRPALESRSQEHQGIHDSYIQFYNHIQNSLVEQTYAAGYELIVRPYSQPADLTHWLIEWGVDGVFWHSSDESLARWIAARFTMIQINRHLRIAADSVVPDQEGIVLVALDHLRQLGHRRIALISHSRNDSATRARNRTYLEYMRQNGLAPFERWIAEDDIEKIIGMLAERSPQNPSALIVGDYSALVIQQKLRQIGFSLPKDLNIVGIDNVSASDFSNPRLTSVDIQIEEITRVSLSLMISRFSHTVDAFQKIEVSPRLVVRDSCCAFQEIRQTK
jgi:LacI family transcriptional regulator